MAVIFYPVFYFETQHHHFFLYYYLSTTGRYFFFIIQMDHNSSSSHFHHVSHESGSKLTATPSQIMAMLNIIEENILPKTREGVNRGNKVFGAAILDSNYETVYSDTNNEIHCPILHGEVNTILGWSAIVPASDRGLHAKSAIFLSTHEPCCMCISSIVWAGFNTVFYFFPYAITTDQGIPWDVETMHELWGVDSYRRENKFCKTACLIDLIDSMNESEDKNKLIKRKERLINIYHELSKKYHNEKGSNSENSLVLN